MGSHKSKDEITKKNTEVRNGIVQPASYTHKAPHYDGFVQGDRFEHCGKWLNAIGMVSALWVATEHDHRRGISL